MQINTPQEQENAIKEIDYLNREYERIGKMLAEYSEAVFTYDAKRVLRNASRNV